MFELNEWFAKPWRPITQGRVFTPENERASLLICQEDIWERERPDWLVSDILQMVSENPSRTFLLTTNNPARMRSTLHVLRGRSWREGRTYTPAPNLWLGACVSELREAQDAQTYLGDTPASVRFLYVHDWERHKLSLVGSLEWLDWLLLSNDGPSGLAWYEGANWLQLARHFYIPVFDMDNGERREWPRGFVPPEQTAMEGYSPDEDDGLHLL